MKTKKILETILFSFRWLLYIMYLRLGMVLCVIIFKSMLNGHLTIQDTIWSLEMVDETMVANLIKSIITGSYNSFIDKEHGYKNENVSSGILKVKMGSSLIGISSIYLLKIFLELREKNISWDIIWKYLAIHGAFLISSLILAYIELLHSKSELHEAEEKHIEKHLDDPTPSNVRKLHG